MESGSTNAPATTVRLHPMLGGVVLPVALTHGSGHCHWFNVRKSDVIAFTGKSQWDRSIIAVPLHGWVLG